MQNPLTRDALKVFSPELSNDTADAMLATAWARAQQAAPCLREDAPDLDSADVEIIKDVLRSAILRWDERGSGAVAQRTAGEYGETFRASDSSTLFRPNEIRDLQSVCGNVRKRGRASTISTIPPGYHQTPTVHPFLTGGEGDDEFGGF